MRDTVRVSPIPIGLKRFENKSIQAKGRVQVDLPDYLPARMLNEFVYCPRLFFYEWVESIFAHSADTVEGALRHEKLETKSDPLPAPDREAQIHSRSVTLSSETHRLIAKMDLIEGEAGAVVPVDYKKGNPRDTDDGPEAWPADRVQLCAQALVLRDNGYKCEEAVAYYHSTRQRVRVVIDDRLIEEVLRAVEDARGLALAGEIPPPLVDSPKCPRCSLVGICLPDETALYKSIREAAADPQLSLFNGDGSALHESDSNEPIRRLIPARDDLRPLYVTGLGLIVGKSGEVLQIKEPNKPVVQEVRVGEISQVNVFGNVQFTAAAVQGLCWSEAHRALLVRRMVLWPHSRAGPEECVLTQAAVCAGRRTALLRGCRAGICSS